MAMDGEVKIVDEQTGRIMKAAVILTVSPGHREAKELCRYRLPPRLCHHHLAESTSVCTTNWRCTGTAED